MRFSDVNLLAILAPLTGIGLVVTGACGWRNTTYFHLPISHFVSFVSTFLPILSLGVVQYMRVTSRRQTANARRNLQLVDSAVLAMFALLLVDTTVITLSANSLSADQMSCPLNERWTELWSSPLERGSLHPAIESIQDALGCCGFKSDKDRFYPFPAKNVTCTKIYPKRVAQPCYTRWLQQQQLSASLVLSAAIGSVFIKVVAFLFIKYPQHPLAQLFLSPPWFGRRQLEEVSGDGRAQEVEDDEERRYEENTVNPNRNVPARVPATENDSLLGAGGGNSDDDGQGEEIRRLGHDSQGFWGVHASSLLR